MRKHRQQPTGTAADQTHRQQAKAKGRADTEDNNWEPYTGAEGSQTSDNPEDW